MFTRIVSAFIIFFHVSAFACTTFYFEKGDQKLFSKSYDWRIGYGHFLMNRKGMEKTSLKYKSTDLPMTWSSLYDSVTFNQFGREFAHGGMNEKGLMIEILWLNGSVYPTADSRKSINELQWVQYNLDTHANVAEVLANAPTIRVSPVYAEVHYMVCDAKGDCATLEYVDGKLVTHSTVDKNMAYRAITNSTYSNSSAVMKDYKGFGGTKAIPLSGYGSLDRFVRANYYAQKFSTEKIADPVSYAFTVLDTMESVGYTRWQIVYDPVNLKVSFRTKSSIKPIANFNVGKAVADCSSNVLYTDLENALRGNLDGNLKPYSATENKKLVQKSLQAVFGSAVPAKYVNAVAAYPASTTCKK
jgi:penicillin V acylase-like amidase (Ntn superfamily)